MHLSQPVLRSSGFLVPADDDPPVSPAFMFDNLSNSELDVRWPRRSGLDALSEISVFISKHENLKFLFILQKIFQTISLSPL